MASVASASPSGQVFLRADSTDETDSWQYVENNTSPAEYIPSPSSSFNGWGFVGYPNNRLGASPTSAMSPLPPDQHDAQQFGRPAAAAAAPTSYPTNQQSTTHVAPATTAADATGSYHHRQQLSSALGNQSFMFDHELFFPDLSGGMMDINLFPPSLQDGNMSDMSGFEGMNLQGQRVDLDIPIDFQNASNVEPWAPMNIHQQDENFMFITPLDDVNGGDGLQQQQQQQVSMSRSLSHHSAGTGVSTTGSSHSHHSSLSMPSTSALAPASSVAGAPKPKQGKDKDTDPIKKIRGSSGKVKKKSSTPVSNFVVVTPNTIHQQSGKPNPFECFEVIRGSQRGRKGPLANKAAESALNIRRMGACFCCRSRKVKCDEERPCKNCKKISAQVPQVLCWQFADFLPVLFPEFIRGHFKKSAMTRFITDNVSSFYPSSSLTTTGGNGNNRPCFVELTSGSRFRSTLTVPASFFTPKGVEVLQHWHMSMGTGQMHQLDLHARSALPLGIDPSNPDQREALRRRAREYVQGLVEEPRYAEQVTEPLRGTQLPRRVLSMVQRFAQRSQSSMVKRALGIYATHYVLTRQLCLTPGTLARLNEQLQPHQQQQQQQQQQPSSFMPPGMTSTSYHHYPNFATARILNRQVKAVLDDYLLKETQSLFTSFGSALKPRSRAEWAPCLASFLVLCLLFESIEAAADTFVVSEAEIALRGAASSQRRRSVSVNPNMTNTSTAPGMGMNVGMSTAREATTGFAVGGRKRALDVVRDIDNLPFRQVAYRFHAVYQTHHVREPGVGTGVGGSNANTNTNTSTNANTNGNGNGGNANATFNPLRDPKLDMDLEPAAAELAAWLRNLLDDSESWHELDFLAADPILSSQAEAHPYPRDITLDYTGRLLARFLLSFTDEKYLFD